MLKLSDAIEREPGTALANSDLSRPGGAVISCAPRPGKAAARTMRRAGLAAATAVLSATSPMAADAQSLCRQALVFALDVSSSVDDAEYRQQFDGLAGALQEPDVIDAVLGDPEAPMAVAVFEWSSREYSALVVDWILLRSEADVDLVATRLRDWERHAAPSETALGTGLRIAGELLARAPECLEETIDISADGKNNDGPSPSIVHANRELEDVTVNALVVGTASGAESEDELEGIRQYLRENVVRGPGSFVAAAQSYADYASAMRRKLLKEIARTPAATSPDRTRLATPVSRQPG